MAVGYTLVELVGRGRCAEVWKAKAPGGEEVALKFSSRLLDTDSEGERELHGLWLGRFLRHPSLVGRQAFWIHENQLVIVMDLADGNLRHRLEQCQTNASSMPLGELLQYTHDVAHALDYLHSQSIAHGAVTPDNVLVRRGHALLGDFSQAHAMGDRAAAFGDQHGLVCTYAEMRLGRPLTGMPDSHLQALRQDEREVILKGLAREPSRCFATCQEFAQALQSAVENDPSDCR